ncbi:MAG: hypothetical protein MUF16_02735 [Burkholderiaceae bacterium]|nr:hypothetical protein [Burkholderiaceae bacterium]
MAFSGHQVTVWIAEPARDRGTSWSLSGRIASDPRVTLATPESPLPARMDRLIVQCRPVLQQHGVLLARLAEFADCLTFVTYGDRSRGCRQAVRQQWRERRWLGCWFAKVDRVAYKDGPYPLDLFGLMRPRHVVGFDAHSLYLDKPDLYAAIHDGNWDVEARRPYRANFIGSRDPDTRSRILDSVERFFTAPTEQGRQGMVWHVFTDAEPAALSQEEFIRALGDSDFTLAPLGYSLVTHRPVEALLRGSIPVLNADELDLYDLGLKDGVNCIAVPRGGWPAAMERIGAMADRDVVAMRRHVRSMLASQVAYPALARSISRRLGVV